MEEYMMQTLGYYDGKYDEIDKMVVPFDDRSHYYGDGVYDATCAGNHVIFNLDEHVDRFFNSAALLKIEIPHTKQEVKDKVFNKVWTPEEKFELVSKVIAGIPKKKVAIEAGINPGMLYQWLHKYKLQGYNGLVESKKGRPTKEPRMKKSTNPLPLTESEREELIRLRAENEYIKAENEVIKKRIALRQEKWAAQLKAKKQQSSKNSEKRDTN